MIDLRGVNATVTGSTRGLGLAITAALVHAGANVVGNGRSQTACAAAKETLGSLGDTIEYVVGGIEDEATAEELVSRCSESFGTVNFVVNNAGITRDKSLLNMSVDDFDEVIAVHLRGSWLMSRAATRAMKAGGGAILNVTSGSALFGLVGQSNYAAAKGGINAMTRALSLELHRFGIRVNALYPIALTDMTAPVIALSGGADSPLREVFGDAGDVARIVLGFAAPTSSAMTGQIVGFDGSQLSLWSHPDRVYTLRNNPPWTDDEIGLAMGHVIDDAAPLNPDDIGARTRAALIDRSRQPADSRPNSDKR